MILIGQYDSPFVRRVGIALRLYGLGFEHKPWSVFSDAALLKAVNPLMRVPCLQLSDGLVLTDSHMILDYLDSFMKEPLFPRAEPARHHALHLATLGTGLAEKAVSLFYERVLHAQTSALWEARCQEQIHAVLAALDQSRRQIRTPWWFGAQMGHADIAVACALRFVAEAHAGRIDLAPYPALRAHAATCEALQVFQEISQPFTPPS